MNERLGREMLRQAKPKIKPAIYEVLSWSYTHFKCIQIFCISQWSLLNFVIHFLCFTMSFIMSLFYVLLFYLFEKIALRPVSCVAKCLQPCLWQGCLQRKSLEPWNTKLGRQTTEHHSVIKKKKELSSCERTQRNLKHMKWEKPVQNGILEKAELGSHCKTSVTWGQGLWGEVLSSLSLPGAGAGVGVGGRWGEMNSWTTRDFQGSETILYHTVMV